MSFQGKKVLVTGAGRGIGLEVCKALHKQGALVFALSLLPEELTSLAEECPGIRTIEADLADWDKTREAMKDLEVMDALVNNAGMGWVDRLLTFDVSNYDKVMNTNVKSAINVSQIVSSKMIEAGRPGSIVNVSSVNSKFGSDSTLSYAISKAAVDILTKCMAVELGPKNIRVNSVNPSIVMTPMGKYWWGQENAKRKREEVISRTPMGRFVEVEEVVNTILFLLGDSAPTVHGQNILIDGGYSA